MTTEHMESHLSVMILCGYGTKKEGEETSLSLAGTLQSCLVHLRCCVSDPACPHPTEVAHGPF